MDQLEEFKMHHFECFASRLEEDNVVHIEIRNTETNRVIEIRGHPVAFGYHPDDVMTEETVASLAREMETLFRHAPRSRRGPQ
jgi:hypothetical protein